jgi:hypothetical protein
MSKKRKATFVISSSMSKKPHGKATLDIWFSYLNILNLSLFQFKFYEYKFNPLFKTIEGIEYLNKYR